MIQKQYLVALGALSAVVAACGSAVTDPPGLGGGSSGSGNGSSGSSSTAGVPGASGSGSGSTGSTGAGGNGSTGASGSTSTTTGGSSTGTAGNGSTNGGTPGGGSTGTTGGTTSVPTCTPGVPATSQIPRLLNRQYDAVVRDLLGVTTIPTADNKLPSAVLLPDFNGPMNKDSWGLYQDVGAKIAASVMSGANKSKFISCDPATAGCLTQTIKTFGRKAFRRPLTDAEVARFEKLGQTTPKGTPAEVAETTLYSFLVSPSFLQITELGQEKEGTNIKLTSFEIAARLSFLLWGSIPDDALSAAADAGMLSTKEQILAQASRMIAVREKTAPFVQGFHRFYLDMQNADSHWWKIQHDTTKYPLYNHAAEPTYMAELDSFFEDVVFSNGSFKDIFLSNIGYVTKDTAAIYGLDPAKYGATMTRVELDAAQRPGFLTRIGFLQSYSHFDGTSPILRGAYVTVNLIGTNPGAPDPNAFLVPAPPGNYKTEREYVEALTNQPACAGCHIPFVNPPGFVLENYDAIGKWQTTDPRGGPINATANVAFADGAKPISTPRALMEELGKGAKGRRIYAEKWVAFAYSRSPNVNDACVVNDLDGKLGQDGYTVLKLLADLTQADSVRLRVRGN